MGGYSIAGNSEHVICSPPLFVTIELSVDSLNIPLVRVWPQP